MDDWQLLGDGIDEGSFAAFCDAVSSGRMICNLDHLPGEPGEALVLGSLLQWLSYRFYEKLATAYPESEAAEKLAAGDEPSASRDRTLGGVGQREA